MTKTRSRRTDVDDDPVPALAAEAVEGFGAWFFDRAVCDPPIDDVIADPLPPSDGSAVGGFDVEDAIVKAKRVTLYADSSELGPVPMTRSQVRDLVRAIRASREPAMITARFEGTDLVVRTLEFIPRTWPSP